MRLELEMDKQEMRKSILRARDALNPVERERGNILLTERILGHQWFYGSEVLLCFVSIGSEIDTGEIMREAFRRKKKVYVPKVILGSQEPRMRFYRIASLEELSEGYRGIPEPSGMSEEFRYEADEGEDRKSVV